MILRTVARFDRNADVTSLGTRQYGQDVCNKEEGLREFFGGVPLCFSTLLFATIGGCC